uniref:Deoxyribonuclease I n=1 Tax=Tetraodon nigroviridis TaxID=99883 RepID=H3C105_TETNG
MKSLHNAFVTINASAALLGNISTHLEKSSIITRQNFFPSLLFNSIKSHSHTVTSTVNLWVAAPIRRDIFSSTGMPACLWLRFSREPFVVMFSSTQAAVGNFVLIPQHTRPGSAVKEIDALYDVVADVYRRWNTKDILLLGDFNAGCNYVTQYDWQCIRLFTDKSFHWLITDAAVTTVSEPRAGPLRQDRGHH